MRLKFMVSKNILNIFLKIILIIKEVGTLMPGAEVTIADVTNQGQCGIGRLGEVFN